MSDLINAGIVKQIATNSFMALGPKGEQYFEYEGHQQDNDAILDANF